MKKLRVATPSRWSFLISTSLASLGLLLCLPSQANAQSDLTWAQVESIRNEVRLVSNGRSRPADVDDYLGLGDALATASNALAELRFNDGSLARVGSSAIFRFTPNTRNFRLSNGTVLLLVPPGQGRTTLQTPGAVTGIQGSALFVRFIPETNTTIIGALTNNPAGPMVAINKDGSLQEPLYAGDMAVIGDDQTIQRFSFDLEMFYNTSSLVVGLSLDDPEVTTGDAAIDAVRQETLEALETQGDFDAQGGVVENPTFLATVPPANRPTIADIQDFDNSIAEAFLRQTDNSLFSVMNQSTMPGSETPAAPPPANPPANPEPPAEPPPTPPTTPPPTPPSNPEPPIDKPERPPLSSIDLPLDSGQAPTAPVSTAPTTTAPAPTVSAPTAPAPTAPTTTAPAPTVSAPTAPTTTAPNQPIDKPIRPALVPAVPTASENIPPTPAANGFVEPVDIIEAIEPALENEVQVDRLTEADILIETPADPASEPRNPPPGQAETTPGQSGAAPPGSARSTPGQSD